MGLVAKDSGGSFTPAPEGTHIAICCQIIDLGTQYSKFYEKEAHKILLGWELPLEVDKASGEPILVWQRYTLSLNEKSNLAQHLQSWRGRAFTDEELEGFQLRNILSKPCMVSIIHDKTDNGTYAKVKAVTAVPKGTPIPNATHKPVVFDIDAWDEVVFDTFSDNLKKTILESSEGKAKFPNSKAAASAKPTAGPAGLADDDIPFHHLSAPCGI